MPRASRRPGLKNRERTSLGLASQAEIDAARRPQLNQLNLKYQRRRLDSDLVVYSAKLEAARMIYNEWDRFITDYTRRNGERIGKAAFKADWKIIRLWLGLQDRLFVEQMLYDRGGFYRRLVSGFRPLE